MVSRSSDGPVTTGAFIWLMAWVRALPAESLAFLSMRIISTAPWPDLEVGSATPARTARAAISASVGGTLPLPIAERSVRSVHLYDGVSATGQETGDARAVGTRAFNTQSAHFSSPA